MAPPLATTAPRARGPERPDAVAALVGVALLAGVAWPVAAVLGAGLAASPVAAVVTAGLTTLAVALVAALGALLPAAVVAYAITRVDVPGRGLAWQVIRLGVLVPPFVVPLALVLAGAPGGLAAIAAGQALAFLPHAAALLVRALAAVPADLEQAAEVLGAPWTQVLRRVTLGLAGPGIRAAALAALGLCLADVAAPLLLGGEAVLLVTLIVAAPHGEPAASAALALGTLGALIALVGGRAALGTPDGGCALPRLDRRGPAVVCWGLGAAVWLLLGPLVALWAVVPLGALAHGGILTTAPVAGALGASLLLGLGVALVGVALALALASILRRARPAVARAVAGLARAPVLVPGVVGGAGYALVAGGAGGLPVLVPLVVCWLLPRTAALARRGLPPGDLSMELAAVSLGAGRLTVLRRIAIPTLAPAAGRVLAASFAGAVLATGTVVGAVGTDADLGVPRMLALATSGAAGPACAVATVLLVFAGGAIGLGRALAGPERTSIPLA